MIKKLGRILTYVITFIGGFIAAIVALFKLAGKVLDTKSQFGWNGITTLKNYICDQVETLFFGKPRSSRTSSPRYTSYSNYNYSYDNYYNGRWTSPTFSEKEEAEDFLDRMLKCARNFGHVRLRDFDNILDEMALPHSRHAFVTQYTYGWTVSEIEFAIVSKTPTYLANAVLEPWTVLLPRPKVV